MTITLGTVTCGLYIWGNAECGLVRDLSVFRDGGRRVLKRLRGAGYRVRADDCADGEGVPVMPSAAQHSEEILSISDDI
ncbi:hypothetical protein HOK021_07670 [Streptomyces hygroscopicus]|nr:hypothetical protein HOK021_07670 [Streptomyces hygroscopicus]